MKREVRYRLDINYLSYDHDNLAVGISSPIYTKADGLKKYRKAVKEERCIDYPEKPVRVHLWKYNYINHEFCPITIAKNY